MGQQQVLAKSTKIYVARPPSADFRGILTPQTITVTTAAAAAATSITVTALTQPIIASADYPGFLTFTDPVTGVERLAEITDSADIGDTTLTVAPLKRAISSDSTALHPVLLSARTSANFTPNLNNIDSITFDNDGYNDGLVSQAGYTSSAPGNFLPLDAGLMTCMEAVKQFSNVYLEIRLKAPEGYASGWQFKGIAGVTGLPIDVPADNIITASPEFTWRGEPKILRPA